MTQKEKQKKRLLFTLLLLLFSATCFSDTPSDAGSIHCLVNSAIELSKQSSIISAIKAYNTNPLDPQALDKVWNTLTLEDSLIVSLLNNPAADMMRQLIQVSSIQGEGLLIGLNGGLVAATEKTTDFWQGDEYQFTKALHLQPGETFLQQDIIDESTHSMLLKISIPVYDESNKNSIGVLVIGLDQFVINMGGHCPE